MKSKKSYIGIALRTSIALAYFGCSNEKSSKDEYPPPGHMRVISVTPVLEPSSSSANLVPNGDISEFWAGAPTPSYFVSPSSAFSTLTRAFDTDNTYACLQKWLQADQEVGIEKAFRTHLYGVAPAQEYELTVDATNVTGSPVSIGLFEVGADKKTPEPLVPLAISLKQEKNYRQVYTTAFTTKNGVRLIIASRCAAVQPGDTSVIWHSFALLPK